MNSTLATQAARMARNIWVSLALVADDDGLETDLMSARFAVVAVVAAERAMPILIRPELHQR